MSNESLVGKVVKIKPEWQDHPGEDDMRYIVVEDLGDRLHIEAQCDMRIKPVELVRREMIELA